MFNHLRTNRTHDGRRLVGVMMVVLLVVGATLTPASGEDSGYVVDVSGEYVDLISTTPEQSRRISNAPQWDGRGNVVSRMETGDVLSTPENATALLWIPDTESFVGLAPQSEIAMGGSGPSGGAALVLSLRRGSMFVVDSDLTSEASTEPSSKTAHWLLVKLPQESGFALLKEGACQLAVEPDGTAITVLEGEVHFGKGVAPEMILDELSGELNGAIISRVVRTPGVRISNTGEIMGEVTEFSQAHQQMAEMAEGISRFARGFAGVWLANAEKGELTPVKQPGRGAAEALAPGYAFVFDEQRPVVLVQAPLTAPSAVEFQLSPVRELLGSGFPGSVIAGSRFLQSRVISRSGELGSNPFIESPLLIRLAD